MERVPRVIVICGLTVSLFLCHAGCGGGGGGDVVDSSPQLPAASTLNYSVGMIPGTSLTLEYPEGGATIDNLFLSGTIRTDTFAMTSDPGSRMHITRLEYRIDGATDNLFDPMVPWVDEPLSWGDSGYPEAGALNVITNSGGSDWVRILADPSVPPDGGALLANFASYTPTGVSATLPWEGLIDAADNVAAPLYQRKASLGLSTLQYGYVLVGTVVEWLAFLDEDANKGRLPSGAITETCDEISPGNRGTRRIAWHDGASPDGQVGPGDSFTVTYTQCFANDPESDVDEILNGVLRLNRLILTDTPAFAIGMEEAVFENFSMTETHANAPTIHVRTTNGAMTLFFSE